MAKRKYKKGGKVLPEGVDPQAVELHLSREERACLRCRESNISYAKIARQVYSNNKTRQAVQLIVQRAKRKLWRLGSVNRFRSNPGACSVEEAPLPARTRRALMEKGIKTLGKLASVPQSELSKIEGVGDYGAHLIVKLLLERGVRGVHALSYCVKCGNPLDKPVDTRKRRIQCSSCRSEFKVEIVKTSEAAEELRRSDKDLNPITRLMIALQ